MANNKNFIAKNGFSTGDGYSMPDIRPSLLLDFANSKTLDPRITFTRGSTATYWDGKTTTKAEENLFTYSQDIVAGNWNVSGLTITDNQTAPDGTSTAQLLTVFADTGYHYVYAGVTPATETTNTFSVYAKNNGANYVYLRSNSTASYCGVVFDLSNGGAANTEGGSSIASYSATDVGNGWYRLSVTFNVSLASQTQILIDDSGAGGSPESWTGDGTSGIYVWGAQLENRSSATAYTATTTAPIVKYQPTLQTAASGEARFDHDPVTGESKGLLIEETRTNLANWSQIASNFFSGNLSDQMYDNAGIAPDGTHTADLVHESTLNEHQSIYGLIGGISGSTAYTRSCYFKSRGSRYIALMQYDGFTNHATTYDLQDGAVVSTQGSATGTIEDVGNGWFRCSQTYTTTAGASAERIQIGIPTGANAAIQQVGDGWSGVLFWGWQLEAGSFPTSYIPTSGSTVTRSEDQPNVTDLSWFNNQEGSFSMEGATLPSLSTTGFYSWWSIEGDTSGEENRLILYNNNRLYYQSSASTYSAVGSVPRDGTFFKASGSFKYGDSISAPASFNGVSAEYTGANGPKALQPDILRIGRSRSNLYPVSGHIKKLAFFTKQLNQTTLNAITEE